MKSFQILEVESDSAPIAPQRAAKEIKKVVDEKTIVTADSGNNRFWLLNYLQTPAVRTYFGSGGVGGMGWATPAAVSAALTTEKDVIAVAGDGGFIENQGEYLRLQAQDESDNTRHSPPFEGISEFPTHTFKC